MSDRNLGRSFRQEGARYTGVYLGLVRANADPQRMGRILVWVSDFGPDQEEYYVTVSYASPFAGATPVDSNVPEGQTMDESQKSYGWWATPPDVDNQVLVCFLNGDTTKGYYFACLYQQNMNHMVPGVSFGQSTDETLNGEFSPYGPPVVEYNKKQDGDGNTTYTSTTATGQDTASVRRPAFTPLASGLTTQGLAKDPERGPSNTSARRESPSNVYGYLSPRGNTIHIDDGYRASPTEEPANEFIRLRTRSGAQILIHETSGYIYLITKGGKSWVELSDGGIDMYSEGPISMSTLADFNLTAKGSINLSAGNNLNLRSGTLSSYTKNSTNFHADTDFLVESTNDTFFKATKNFGIDSGKTIGMEAEGDILMAACGIISRNAKGILDNSGGGMPEQATPVQYTKAETASRVPKPEPYDHSVSTTTGNGDGVDANGNITQSVVGSDGAVNNVPVKGNQATLQKYLYEGFKKRGMTDEGAYAMVAQIGRENDYREAVMYGYHNDPNPKVGVNIGMVSWNGSRGRTLESRMKQAGLLNGGVMKKGSASLDFQMDYVMEEMKTKRLYSKSYRAVTTPGLTYAQIEPVLSNNYEVWDTAGHTLKQSGVARARARMNNYYAAVKKSNPAGKA